MQFDNHQSLKQSFHQMSKEELESMILVMYYALAAYQEHGGILLEVSLHGAKNNGWTSEEVNTYLQNIEKFLEFRKESYREFIERN